MKECKRKFNKNKFSFKLRQRNLLKKRKIIVKKFCRRPSQHDCMFRFVLHAKAKIESLLSTFAVILTSIVLPILPKVEYNFEVL